MENTLIKIEETEDGKIAVHLNGDVDRLSSMLASAIKNEEMFGMIFTTAMVKLLAFEESKNEDEIIRKSRLN
jgi:microcompartment protein CcmL/EutN